MILDSLLSYIFFTFLLYFNINLSISIKNSAGILIGILWIYRSPEENWHLYCIDSANSYNSVCSFIDIFLDYFISILCFSEFNFYTCLVRYILLDIYLSPLEELLCLFKFDFQLFFVFSFKHFDYNVTRLGFLRFSCLGSTQLLFICIFMSDNWSHLEHFQSLFLWVLFQHHNFFLVLMKLWLYKV